jgi:phytanoyl-CoA hydroxylase
MRRCGLTIRYIPTSTRIVTDEQPYPSALLLRGNAGVNVYQSRPVYIEGECFPFADATASNRRQAPRQERKSM